MSTSDRLKAEIAFHEKMFFTSIAVIFAILGWTIEKARVINSILLIGVFLVTLFAIGFSVWNYKQISALLEELENA